MRSNANSVMVGERIQNCNVSIGLGFNLSGQNTIGPDWGWQYPESWRWNWCFRLVHQRLGKHQLGYAVWHSCGFLPPNRLLRLERQLHPC